MPAICNGAPPANSVVLLQPAAHKSSATARDIRMVGFFMRESRTPLLGDVIKISLHVQSLFAQRQKHGNLKDMRSWLGWQSLTAVLCVGVMMSSIACEGDSTPVTKVRPGSSSGGSSGGESSSGDGSSSGESSSGSTTVPRTAGTLRIANFNVRNLLNDKDDSDARDEQILSTQEYQKHLYDVAGGLRTLNADVVVLVEVENQAVLDDLRATPELEGRYEHSAIIAGNDPRGINIGLLSNVPIDDVVSHKEELLKGARGTYKWSRDLPEYHLTFNGHPIVLLGVHFKAFAAAADVERDNDKRLAEAKRAREIADELLEQDDTRPVLLLGDFNADTNSPSTRAVRGDDPEFDQAADALPASSRWTVEYGGERMTYDDQWASPGFASIRNDASLVLRQFPFSDHKAVVCEYDFGDE